MFQHYDNKIAFLHTVYLSTIEEAKEFKALCPNLDKSRAVVPFTLDAEALEILLRSGIHPLVAIKVTGLWADSEKTYLQSKPYLDALWKTVEEAVDTEINRNGLQGQVAQAKQIVGDLNGTKNN